MKNQNTIPFPDEQKHLDNTLKIIDTALEEARKDVLRLDQEYREAKRYMADYRNEMDSHEKLQNEQLLDQTDRKGVFAVELREKMENLKESPYFARIDFVSDGEEEADTFYIGRFGFTHCNEKLIFDWRAPISGMYYDYDIGRAGFEAPVGWIESRYAYHTRGCRFRKNIHCTSSYRIFTVSVQKSNYRRGCNDFITQ